MKRINKLIIAGMLVLGVQTTWVCAEDAPKPPDLTSGGEKDKSHDWLLGPTGLRGWMFYYEGRTTYARQILVTAVDKGSPADGIVAVGDVIQNCLDYLLRYGVHAKEILPSWKGKDYWCNRFPERYKAKKEAIEKSTESPTLVSLQEFIEKAKAGEERKPSRQ
jgi:hypothetical protein